MKKIIILLSLVLVSWGAFAQQDQSSIKVEHSQVASAIIDNYLALKDALVQEDSKNAASFGKKLLDAFAKFDVSTQAMQQQKEIAKIIEDASKHTNHIFENSSDIANQRKHFEFLSINIRDLVLIVGSDRALYQAFCPMYNNNKGGIWLSKSKEIRNPYFGNKMLKCGSVQQEILVK